MSSYNRVQRVEGKGVVNGQQVLVRKAAIHEVYSDAQTSFYRHQFDQPPVGLFRQSGNQYRPILPKGRIGSFKHATISVTLTTSSPIQFAPMPLWFTRLRILRNGSEQLWSIDDPNLYKLDIEVI